MHAAIDLSAGLPAHFYETLLQYKTESDLTVTLINAERYVNDILSFVRRNGIAYPICLKGLEQTTDQWQLDESIWFQQSVQLSSRADRHGLASSSMAIKPIRTRPRVIGQSEISVQNEVSSQTEIAHSVEVARSVEHAADRQQVDLIDFETFDDIVKYQSPVATSALERRQLWHRLLGHVAIYEREADQMDVAEDEQFLAMVEFDPDNITVQPNPYLRGMTQNAAEVIAAHLDVFSDGIDHRFLPDGFYLGSCDESMVCNTLDYQFKDCKQSATLAISLVEASTSANIGQQATERLLQDASEETALLLSTAHDTIITYNYQASDLQSFRYHLPQLMRLSLDALMALFHLCHDEDKSHLDGKKLTYFLNNQPKFSRLLKHTDSEDVFVGKFDWIKSFCQDKSVGLDLVDSCPWLSHLPEITQTTFRQLDHLCSFNQSQIDSLWRLWASQGLPALQYVFETMLDCIKLDQQDAVEWIRDTHDLASIINHPAWQNGFQRLHALDSHQRQWWRALIGHHRSNLANDYLPQLLDQFIHFCREIRRMKLSFYSPVAFAGVRLMPTALSRMLTILKHCPRENLNEQWHCITQLPLHASGAIRALDESSPSFPCAFITPQMRCFAPNYDFAAPDNQGYRNITNHKGILTAIVSQLASDAELEEMAASFPVPIIMANADNEQEPLGQVYDQRIAHLFAVSNKSNIQPLALQALYRYLSRSQYKSSLAFYQRAIDDIDTKFGEVDEKGVTRTLLYLLLAGCTTGLLNREHVNINIDKSFSSWQALTTYLQTLDQLPGWLRKLGQKDLIRLVILALFASPDKLPNIDDLFSLIKLFEVVFDGLKLNMGWLTNPTAKISKIIEPLTLLMPLMQNDHIEQSRAFILSIRYLNPINFSSLKSHLFDIYQIISMLAPEDTPSLDDTELMNGYISALLADEALAPTVLAIISLKSQFSISIDDWESIRTIDFTHPIAQYSVELLCQMSSNRDLNAERLVDFMQALPKAKAEVGMLTPIDTEETISLTKQDYQSVHQLIQMHFADCYSSDYFTKLSGDVIDKAIQDQIYESIAPSPGRKKLLGLLRRYPKSSHHPLMSVLLPILQRLPEDNEAFLMAITDDELFEISQAKQFTQLLSLFADNGNPSTWMFIIQACKRQIFRPDGAKACRFAVLHFWLALFSPKLNVIIEGHQHLAARAYDIVFRGYVAARQNVVEHFPDEEKTVDWVNFCLLLQDKPMACDTLLDLMTVTVADEKFSQLSLKTVNKLLSFIDEKTSLSLASFFRDQPINQFYALLDKIYGLDEEVIRLIADIIKKHADAELALDDNAFDLLIDKQYHEFFSTFYTSPPYPRLPQIAQWLSDGNDATAYEAFCMAPAPRSGADNGFYHDTSVDDAYRKISQHPSIDISREEIICLYKEAVAAKTLPLNELKNLFYSSGSLDTVPIAKLTAVAAELLYRSKAQPHHTYELNQMQYLAVYIALRDGQRAPFAGQFESGEGKSRVFMVIAAALLAQNKTVELITRNMTLATRDFVCYQPYFDLIGYQSTIIYSHSPESTYRPGQIHFSDASNFCLFLSQQLCRQREPRVQEVDRALLLDEADQLFFDSYMTRYNFATTSFNLYANMNWVYDCLMTFFTDRHNLALYFDNIDACNQAFRNQVSIAMGEQAANRLAAIDDSQIETWHDAAIKAMNLQYLTEFNLSIDETMLVPGKGRQINCRANVVEGNRGFGQSTFANGVQQCLHAHLNRLQDIPADGTELSLAAKKAKTPFIISPESDIIYFMTSKELVESYGKSTLIALTGTLGNQLELTELQRLYQATSVKFPRFNPLRRVDLPMRLCMDEAAQFQAILENIAQLHLAHQPVLIFCENDVESKALYQSLRDHFSSSTITWIHSNYPDDEELKHAKTLAGKSNHITVSTDMYGRGVNIVLHGEAKNCGLGIILTYMPKSKRDYLQSINRAGRYGENGSSRLIINKQRLLKRTHQSDLPGRFFIHNQKPEQQAMVMMNQPSQLRRLITLSVSDFQVNLKRLFFQHLRANSDKAQQPLLHSWVLFEKISRQAWEQHANHLATILAQKPLDIESVQRLVNEYGTFVCEQFSRKFPDILCEQTIRVDSLVETVSDTQPELPGRSPFFKHYDRAHDGFAVRYDHWFAQTKATWRGDRRLFANTRAWWQGEGMIFANLHALFRGDITLWQYLFPVPRENTHNETWDSAEISTPS